MADHAWSGLKPSRVADAGGSRWPDPSHGHPHPQGSLRGADQWTPAASSDELPWGVAGAGCLVPRSTGLEGPSAPGALKRLVPERSSPFVAGGAGAGGHGEAVQHRQGWKRFPSVPTSEGKDVQQRHCYRFDSTPCSEWKLDEELTMFESHLTRTLSDRFSNISSRATSSLKQEMAALVSEGNSEGVAAGSAGENSKTREGEELKRQRSGPLSDTTENQAGHGWIPPLKLLVRKGLTLSDVGELGRIIIPKKDAESQSFPQIDTKEGAVLELEDYTVSKRWYFRFKYWINNKSRMYVLENTGEFIKYHSLQEQDMFFMYEDGCKNLVVCGRKKLKFGNLDPLLDVSNLESSPNIPPTTTSTSGTTNIDNTISTSP